MTPQIILVMREEEYEHFAGLMRERDENLQIFHAASKEELIAYKPKLHTLTRIICFSTYVIVPADIIDAVGGNCYNFHPGPPLYPGFDPLGLALYQGENMYGVTLHELVAEIDAGPIVDTVPFPILPDDTRDSIVEKGYGLLAHQFVAHLDALMDTKTRLPRSRRRWGKNRTTRASIKPYYDLLPIMGEEEIARRKRAFGNLCSDKTQ
ncbi:MAG: formyltransferase family protein [Pseudomonadota bacterium]